MNKLITYKVLPPGNFGNREMVIDALVKLQRRDCYYHGKDLNKRNMAMCDCKYGGPTDDEWDEANGCPELKCAITILEHMTDDMWETLRRREAPIEEPVSNTVTIKKLSEEDCRAIYEFAMKRSKEIQQDENRRLI